MSDILRQVDEELRQDRLLRLWRRYRIYLIVGLISIIFILLWYQINKSVNQSFNEEIVEQYISISEISDLERSIQDLNEVEQSNHSLISGIAKIKIANLLMEKGSKEESRAKLLDIINDGNIDKLLVDLAIYFYLMSNLKDIQPEEIDQYLTKEKIMNSPFKYLFIELKAMNYLLSGNIELSRESFNNLINDINVPKDIGSRASKFIDSIE